MYINHSNHQTETSSHDDNQLQHQQHPTAHHNNGNGNASYDQHNNPVSFGEKRESSVHYFPDSSQFSSLSTTSSNSNNNNPHHNDNTMQHQYYQRQESQAYNHDTNCDSAARPGERYSPPNDFYPLNSQFHQHLTTHYEQSTLPSPHSISGSCSSITESTLDRRIKFSGEKVDRSSSRINKKTFPRIGGIKSRPIKYLKHPLDRSITSFFLLTLFFTLLAILTGLPVVLVLTLLLLPSMLILKCLNCSFGRYPETMVKATPLETFWLNPKDFTRKPAPTSPTGQPVTPPPFDYCTTKASNSISTCLLIVDSELDLGQLRDIFMTRVVQKPEMARFRSILQYKGFTRTPVWSRLSFEEFSIEEQIINDLHPLTCRRDLKTHLVNLMQSSLPPTLPLWQIRRCRASYLNKVILIIRVHQSVIDGIGLSKLLVSYLADQAPPKTTTFIRTTQGTTATTGHFKPRFGGINFTINLIRAVIVGPLSFILWVIWAFTKRKNNYLRKIKVPLSPPLTPNNSNGDPLKTPNTIKTISASSSSNSISKYPDEAIITPNGKHNSNPEGDLSPTHNKPELNPVESIYWTTIELSKIVRVKQVTRSCLNDVILAAITGSIRQNMISKNIFNPPDIGMSLPVDVRSFNDPDDAVAQVKYVMLTSPLPTSIEGAIPRLWEIRHNMEELKTSADPSVMYGAQYFLHSLLPGRLYRWIVDLIHRNSSICSSNVQGPTQELSICSHRLRKVLFWMDPPNSVSVSFNAFSYENRLYVTVTSCSELIPCAKSLAKAFKKQVNLLNDLLSKRRVPGEGRPRKRPTYLVETPFLPGPYLTSELTAKLNAIQLERYQMNELLESSPINREDIEFRLEELKDEFSELMKQLRRRKSVADYGMHNIVINVEDNENEEDDDDLDGELRPSMRRFSFNMASRRSSVASAISMPSSRFQVSPPHLSRRYVSSSPEPSSPSEPYIKEETV